MQTKNYLPIKKSSEKKTYKFNTENKVYLTVLFFKAQYIESIFKARNWRDVRVQLMYARALFVCS